MMGFRFSRADVRKEGEGQHEYLDVIKLDMEPGYSPEVTDARLDRC